MMLHFPTKNLFVIQATGWATGDAGRVLRAGGSHPLRRGEPRQRSPHQPQRGGL